jgi:tetratricopeptide (TPR) repeat protein
VIGYDAPVSRWRGTALHLTDQATNILHRLLAEPALAEEPLVFIGHSLGGLIIKQLLRTAESMARYDARAAGLIERVGKVGFLATPHSGAGLATWGDRLRILVRPSAATASLVRNDPNLRDLNIWYRNWANARGIAHLVLAETKPTSTLGLVVRPDSADPGLANMQLVPVSEDHRTICKPADKTQDIYVFVRDFVIRPVQQPKPLADVVVEKVVKALDARGEGTSIEKRTILELARRLKPKEILDLDQALQELTAAVEVAIEVSENDKRGSNLGDLVDGVLARVAAKTRAGDIEGAAAEADQGIAEWEQAEGERRAVSFRSGVVLLEAGLKQDILRRDASAAAARVARISALEHPDDVAARFKMMRERQDTFFARGRDKGVNFDLLIAIEIARLSIEAAQDRQQRGTALNDLGTALETLGDRESVTTRLKEAVNVYREALTELTRERAPLDWAMTQNNLGNALAILGRREGVTTRLREAITAYRAALMEYTRKGVPLKWAITQNNIGNVLRSLSELESNTALLNEAVKVYREVLTELAPESGPLDWAMTQYNLGNAFRSLGERESGTERLKEAVYAYREALTQYTRKRVPLDWAMTQNSLGNALARLGERESSIARLTEAVTAYRAALQGWTRERVPLKWAITQNNIGNALRSLGDLESNTTRLKEAINVYREALTELTPERAPLDWAATIGNQGVAFMLIAERKGDASIARSAAFQIEQAGFHNDA